jgi:hypothetical protein
LKEQYSESEVRHLVGEYDEVKWEGIRTELLKNTNQVKTQLEQTQQEIARLNEVLGTIRAPARPEPAPAPALAPPPPPAPSPVAEAPTEAEAPPSEEPEGTTRAGGSRKAAPKKDEQGRTLWFPSGKGPESAGQGAEKLDELAFLKSVTDAESLSSASGRTRSSGSFPKPAATEPAEPRAAAPSAPEAKERPSQGTAPKTLKCGECGTLNRPTEWYCERCGAELATL